MPPNVRVRAPLILRGRCIQWLSLLALLWAWASPHTAAAAPQVSSEFTRVAKQLAKRLTSDRLRQICDKKADDAKPVCQAVADAAGSAFTMAIDGKVDEEALDAVLVDLATDLTEVAAADAAKHLIGTLFAEIGRETQARCVTTAAVTGKVSSLAVDTIANEVAACVVDRALRGHKTACNGIETTLRALTVTCGQGQDDPSSYPMLLLLTQIKRLIAGESPAGFYAAVASAAQSYEAIYAGIDSPNDAAVFDRRKITALLADDPQNSACTNLPALRKRLMTWQANRLGVFLGVSRALASFQPLSDELLAQIPVDLPDPGCRAGNPLAQAALDFKRFALTYRTDVKVVHTVDPFVLPALLGALLVDYVSNHDDRVLRQHVEDLALRVLARAIAARDTDALICDNEKCSDLVPHIPPREPIAQPQGISDEDVQAIVEERFSPTSARRTCEYQAIASALGHNIQLGTSNACRTLGLTGETSLLSSWPFNEILSPAKPNEFFREWLAPVPVGAGMARLSVTGQIDPSVGGVHLGTLLESIVRGLPDGHPLAPIAEALVDALRPLLDQRSFDFSRGLLAESARELHPLVDKFLDDKLASIKCADGPDAAALSCGVRVLIGAVYDPLVAYIIIENPTDADRKRLATLAYKKALALDPLSSTPLLFNVGLGATGLTRFGSDSWSGHMTLLDKFGLAKRWGARNAFEAGIFVGGFLDAIIRAASKTGATDQYWLAGGTVGWRQFSSTLPFGAELHVAAALPFDLTHAGDRAAFAFGGALIVPADIAFGD